MSKKVAIYNGIAIHFSDKVLMNLTDMWRAVGSPTNGRPRDWLRVESTIKFMEAFEKVSVGQKPTLKTVRGRYSNQGTYAHWQIALAYAQYLSPEFHVWCNQVTKERFEEMANPELAVDRGVERAVKRLISQGMTEKEALAWVAHRIKAIEKRNDLTSTYLRHGINNRRYYGFLTDNLNMQLFGMTANEIKRRRGLPPNGRTRDSFNELELALVAAAETQIKDAVHKTRAFGFDELAFQVNTIGKIYGKAYEEAAKFVENYRAA